ncbi:hypothetical protein EsDP_00000964 [Epichloe bromicola]|uniref:Uncharacterized protein n=1 Tax=Epichloe bromicola TaxID=79588 RepID=A0ABQ0CGH2_9HYPO
MFMNSPSSSSLDRASYHHDPSLSSYPLPNPSLRMSSLPIFSIPRIPLTPSSILYSILLCIFLIVFLRIVYFTLSCASPYSITIGTGHHRGRDGLGPPHPPRMRREMLARTGTSFVGFSTFTSPGGSLHIPDLRLGGGHGGGGRTNEPLLMAHHSHDEPLVELDAFSRDAPDQDQLGNLVAVHGTNALNTSWGWMV